MNQLPKGARWFVRGRIYHIGWSPGAKDLDPNWEVLDPRWELIGCYKGAFESWLGGPDEHFFQKLAESGRRADSLGEQPFRFRVYQEERKSSYLVREIQVKDLPLYLSMDAVHSGMEAYLKGVDHEV